MPTIVDTEEQQQYVLTQSGGTLLVTNLGSVIVDTETAIFENGNNEAVTLDGMVYGAFTSSGEVSGDGVAINGTGNTLAVDSTVQGGASAVQANGTQSFIDVGTLGELQGLSTNSWGLGINGSSAATDDTILNSGQIVGTTGIGISNGGGNSITNGGTISGGTTGINYDNNVAQESVENSGTISGEAYAITSSGSSAGVNIVNSGLLTADPVSSAQATIYLDDATGTVSSIDNKGTILGGSTGTGAIDDVTDTLELTSSGTIHGGIQVSGSNSIIHNSGTIHGSVGVGPGGTNSTIDNSGTIAGNVTLLGAGDALNDYGGTVTESLFLAPDNIKVSLYGGGSLGEITCGKGDVIDDYRGTIDGIDMAGGVTVDYQGLFGEQTITDFTVGTGSTHDTISFAANDFQTFSAVQSAMTQLGADTVIKLDTDNSITLVHVSKTSLVKGDFKFT